jgi:peroxiredoxin
VRAAPLPAPDGSGPTEWAGTEFILRLAGDTSGQQQVESKQGKVQVAPGEYWLTGWKVTVPDSKGQRWTARGGVMGAPTMNARLPLHAGQTRAVPLGGPLGVSLTRVIRGRTALFTLHFLGPLGDRCYEVDVDGKRPPHPDLIILNEKNEVVDRVRFPFGCSFICKHSWRAPEGVSGKLRAVIEANFGPFVVPPGQGTSFEIAANASDEDPVTVGRPAPEFALAEPEKGGAVTLASLRGKPLVLNFFCGCSWCEDVASTWTKRPLPEGVQLVAVWNDAETATPVALRKFRERTGFKGRILADPDHVATLAYNSSDCPRVWVIDATGALRHVNASRTQAPDRIVSEATAAAATDAVAAADVEAN